MLSRTRQAGKERGASQGHVSAFVLHKKRNFQRWWLLNATNTRTHTHAQGVLACHLARTVARFISATDDAASHTQSKLSAPLPFLVASPPVTSLLLHLLTGSQPEVGREGAVQRGGTFRCSPFLGRSLKVNWLFPLTLCLFSTNFMSFSLFCLPSC